MSQKYRYKVETQSPDYPNCTRTSDGTGGFPDFVPNFVLLASPVIPTQTHFLPNQFSGSNYPGLYRTIFKISYIHSFS